MGKYIYIYIYTRTHEGCLKSSDSHAEIRAIADEFYFTDVCFVGGLIS